MRKTTAVFVVVVTCFGRTGHTSAQLQHGSSISFDAPGPKSLEDLINKSSLVVDASVQSILPPEQVGSSGRSETDVLLRVDSVLKGMETSRHIVVSQMGGLPDQIRPMQSGEHYIVFLEAVQPVRRDALPVRAGIPRYDIFRVNIGLFLVVKDKLQLNPLYGIPEYGRLEGMKSRQIRSEITTYVSKTKRQ